ncbi:MAG: hypothetical protein ABIY55_35890 [Kofleriaceae bacterium]
MSDAIEDGDERFVEGVVRADGPLLYGPITGQPCVLHATRVRVWSRLDFVGVLLSEFTTVAQVAFVLETAQGVIPIDAEHARVSGPARELLPPHAYSHALLSERGLEQYAGSTFARHHVVAPGDRVTIRGITVRQRVVGAGELGYRDEPVQLRLVGYPQRPLDVTSLG